MLESLKEIYYSFEDKYYGLMDKANDTVPVYSVIDPIDKVFPSFVLFTLIIAGATIGLFLMLSGGIGFLSPPANFLVADTKGGPIAGAEVEFSLAGKKETKLSNDFGEFQSGFAGRDVNVSARHEGFAAFSGRMTIEPGKRYTIKLDPERKVAFRQIEFELAEQGRAIPDGTGVSMEFSCTSGAAPQPLSRRGSIHSVPVQSTCGTLSAAISAIGFEDARATVNVASQSGRVIVGLSRKQQYGSLRAIVQDADSGEPIEGAGILLKREGGVLVMRGDSTDGSGIAVLESVPAGSYFLEAVPAQEMGYATGRSELFSIGIAEFSGGMKTVSIGLKKLSPTEPTKILLRIIDSASKGPVQGVDAVLIESGMQESQAASDKDGLVEFVNLSGQRSHSVVLSHADYVTKVVADLNLVPEAESSPEDIEVVKAVKSNPGANSGNARINVSEYAGGAVENADAMFFSVLYDFPLAAGKTGSSGLFDVNNLPQGDYFAKASKTINSALYDGNSVQKRLEAGTLAEYPVVLTVSNGKLLAKAVDPEGKPIADANIDFVDSISMEILAKTKTDSRGLSSAVEFAANRRPYLVARKSGFLPSFSASQQLVPSATKQVVITLWPAAAIEGFGVKYDGIYESITDLRAPRRIEAGKQYFIRLFIVSKGDVAESAKAVVRTGLESEANAGASKIAAMGFSSMVNSAVLSACYDAHDNYKECQPTDGNSGAKQVVASFGRLAEGTYEFIVPVGIKAVQEGDPLEIRYGAFASIGGSGVFRPAENELYLVTYYAGKALCTNDCGIEFRFSIQDEPAQILPHEKEIAMHDKGTNWEGRQENLLKDVIYNIDFNIYNDTRDQFENAGLFFMADQEKLQVPEPLNMGRIEAGTRKQGTFQITPKATAASVEMDVNLNIGRKGDSALLMFGISAKDQLMLSVEPKVLRPDSPNYFVAQVSRQGGAGIAGAVVSVYQKGTATLIAGGTTNSDGKALVYIPQGYADGTAFDVNAAKAGYLTATAGLRVAGQQSIPSGFDCITTNGGYPDDSSIKIEKRLGTAQFTLKNDGCNRELGISLSRHSLSDISISPASLTLADGQEATVSVTSGNEYGVHPIFITVRPTGSSQDYAAGILRAIITAPPAAGGDKTETTDTCIYVERLRQAGEGIEGKFTLPFRNRNETVYVINKCYSGVADDENSANPAGQRLPRNDIDSQQRKIADIVDATGFSASSGKPESISEYNLFRTEPLSGDPFFLIAAEDYVKGGN
ncbi:Carboxypeptidase regulatory-like domain protein [uncultured archaeon]|nr:Carboxypeptidase regulatory-like domain protein [uncultured archaeon]